MLNYIKKQWLGALGLAVVAGPFSSASELSQKIEDDVDVFVSFRSIAEFQEQWKGHPFERIAKDPEVQAFFAPLIDDYEKDGTDFSSVLEDEFGLTLEEFFDLFPREFTLSFFNVPELMLEDVAQPEFVLMAEYAGDSEKIDELMHIQFERNAAGHKEINPESEHTLIEESFMGETLRFDEAFDGEHTYIEDGYALVNGIFILATPEERLRLAVEAIKEGPKEALADNGSFARSREMGGRGDALIYINFEEIMPPLNAALMELSMESGAGMFGLSAQSLNAALSLDSLLAFYIDFDVIEGGLRSTSGLLYREKLGLLSLLTYVNGPLPEAGYVPSGVLSTAVTSFDFSAMWAQLEQILAAASPTITPLIDMQMQNVQANSGVDLRASVLRNFGSEIVSLSMLPEGSMTGSGIVEPEQVFLIEIGDPESLSGAIEALKDMVPGMREGIQEKEFEEHTIYVIEGTPDPYMPDQPVADVSYVITRSHFIFSVGRVGLLQEVLTRMGSAEGGFWASESTEALFERVARPDAVSRSYFDLEQLVRPIFESIVQTAQMSGNVLELDMEDIPDNLDMPFVIITEMNEDSEGMYSRSLLIEKEDSE